MEEALEWIPAGAGTFAIAGAAMAAAGAVYIATRQQPKPSIPIFPLDDQAFLEDGKELIRKSRFCKDAKDINLLRYSYEDAKTVYEAFRRGARESNNGKCLGWRENKNKPYQWIHYNEALLRARNFGCGLIHLGLDAYSYIGIYSCNCPEWIICEQGFYCYSMIIVPLYDTLGSDACAFIIQQANMSTVVCEDDGKINMLLNKAPVCLKRIIYMKEPKNATIEKGRQLGITIFSMAEVEKIGGQHLADYPEQVPSVDDICTICYTSGTTGNPKGVMLSHENVIANVSAVCQQLGEHRPNREDVLISFLPLAHMFERNCQIAMYMEGACVGFFSGDVKELPDDFKALKPTVSPTVPRLLNRIYDKAMAATNGSSLKKRLLEMGLNSKVSEMQKGILRRNSIWDMLIFRKIQEGMGGRLRLLVVGSAPLSGNVLTFIRAALGCVVVEGYGQTECVAPCTLTIQGDCTPDHVGPPLACCKIKLVDVPEMEYYASAGQGEVCVYGTTVFKGYFKDPDRTKATIDEDGFLHTGDIGMWLPNGTLRIIDRKKHIFKLSQGEYVAPEKIENIYLGSPFVSQIFVHGESLKSCIIAIVVPNVESLKEWAFDNGIYGTLSVLCADENIKKMIMDQLIQCGKRAGLKSFEQVKDIYLHPDPFSVKNGLLTPTLKSKRTQLKQYFKPQIEDMYSKLN